MVIRIALLVALLLSSTIYAQENSSSNLIPIGWDAYKMWHKWPMQRIGVRAYMRSTYDRSGGNEAADASHFLYMCEEDNNITLDITGKGYLYFIRTNHWHGSPWRYTVDDNSYIVKETATQRPVGAKHFFDRTVFIPQNSFKEPLAYTWSTTKGSNLVWVPIGFNNSIQLAYGRTKYGTGYYIYHNYANCEQLSQPIHSWNLNDTISAEVTNLIDQSGYDIAPKNIIRQSDTIVLNKKNIEFACIEGKCQVRALKFKMPLDKASSLERIHLKVRWDDRKEPSIDVPLCLFFGAGTLYNKDRKEFLVKAFPVNIRCNYDSNEIELACYFPMPFFKSAHFELSCKTLFPETKIEYEVRYEPYTSSINASSYFHATYKDFRIPVLGKDLVLLDTENIEGHKEWSGSFVGTSLIFTHDGFLGTLEGDPRFFFDDSNTPQAQGTGTEEWCGGGDYWGGENMTLPFVGHPCGRSLHDSIESKKELINSCYRFLLADLMPFGKRAKIHLEHGAENLSSEHYESVTYWYGLPKATLILTDEINVGDVNDEKVHRYSTLDSSTVDTIQSRYEWGIDHLPYKSWGKIDFTQSSGYTAGREIFPSHEEYGRTTMKGSEFVVKLHKQNCGVLLRRCFDYQYPNQKARVYVTGTDKIDWQYVGEWYSAGSNTCVFSNPNEELAPRLYNVQTSNRRFREEEFLIPAKMSKGLELLKIKIEFVPVDQELFPGTPFPNMNCWSELRYKVYCYIKPDNLL